MNPNFAYLQLSRTLDQQSRENGYQHCPDDILNLILDYTDDINKHSTGFYQVKVSYTMRSKTNDYRCIKDIRNIDARVDINDEERAKLKREVGLWGKNTNTYSWLKYCGCCNRFYKEIKNHIKRDIHLRNYHNTGDRCINPDFTQKILNSRIHYYYDREIISIDKVEYEEWFINEKMRKL